MTSPRILAAFAVALFAGEALAQQPQNLNVRGTIAGFDGKVLSVKTRDGKDLTVELPDGVNIAIAKAFTLADIKPGMMLAVITLARPDGTVVALDVRPLPPTVAASTSPYDLQPGSAMNNAGLEAMVAAAGGQELMLNAKAGPLKALIVPQTTMSQSAPGTRDDLKPGETVFAVARPEAGGRLVAIRVLVGKDGVKPGQ